MKKDRVHESIDAIQVTLRARRLIREDESFFSIQQFDYSIKLW